MRLTIYIDGACRFNPGPMGIGVFIKDSSGTTVREISEPLGQGTNNVAEWSAYLRALREAIAMGAGEVLICSDSKLLVEQVKGRWKIRDMKLLDLRRQARPLEAKLGSVTIEHVPREQNPDADRLSKIAIGLKP